MNASTAAGSAECLRPRGERWGRTAGLLRAVGDVFFPPVCVGCNGLVETGPLRHVCERCAALAPPVAHPHCTTCGHPFFGEVDGERLCVHCEGLRPAFGEGCTGYLLKGPIRGLVHSLKYRHGLHVLGDIETLIRRSPDLRAFVRGAVLVPVPLHPRKRRERGYNQSELLAGCFARAADGDVSVDSVLVRVVDTESQTHFDRATRRANLKNAFALRPGVVINPSLHYILVDDVFTTGSTLNACAGALRRAGGLNLDVVTFGHG